MRIQLIEVGECAVARQPDLILETCLGSCVAVALYDSTCATAGLLHVLLPRMRSVSMETNVTKFADPGVRILVEKMEEAGARRDRMSARLAGGASLLEAAGGFDLFQIGTRNAETAREMLGGLSIPVVSAETGGHVGRVLRFHVGTGRVTVRVIGQKERDL